MWKQEGFNNIVRLSLITQNTFMESFTGNMIHHILCELPFDATFSQKSYKNI